MKKGNWIVLILLIISISQNSVRAQRQIFVSDELEQNLEVLMQENKVLAVGIGIIEHGTLSSVNVYGNLKKDTPAPDNAYFNIASLSKPISTLLTLRLVSNGDWDLDEPLYHYWIDPDVKDDPFHKIITTRHVLTHTTGFDNWRWNNESKKLIFNSKPGTKPGYSGEGFEYLRLSIESKFNIPFENLVDSLIFKPYGMKNSSLLWDDKVHKSRYAEEHNKEGQPYNLRKRIVNACASDDVITTVEDYGLFAVNVLKATGITEELYKDMIRPQADVRENAAYGLSWFIEQDYCDGEYALTHGGSDAGVATMVVLLPESKRGIIIFTNGDNGFEIINKILDKYRGLEA